MNELIRKNWIFLIPVVFFLAGIAYARSLEAFAGIGIAIMVIVGTFALISGVITYRLTEKIILSVLVCCATFASVFVLVIILARSGL